MQVIAVFMTIGVDQAPLFRKIDDRHLPPLFTKSSGDRTRSCSDLQYIFTSVHRQPADDILPQIRKMIENRPALFFHNHTFILLRCTISGDLQHLILDGSVGILIILRIKAIIQHRLSNLFHLLHIALPHCFSSCSIVILEFIS